LRQIFKTSDLKMELTKNQNLPATKKQLWALYCIYKKDYRNDNLTIQQASDLISQGNKTNTKQNKKEGLLEFLQDNSTKVYNTLLSECKLISLVQNDSFMAEKKSYIFFGSGCGFAHIEYDKRSKVATNIMNEFINVRRTFITWFINQYVDKPTQDKLQKLGSPIQAIMAQNMLIQSSISWIVIDYMKSKGVKKASVRTILD
jgi:hypothetical protein